jgi:hypothetical protein
VDDEFGTKVLLSVEAVYDLVVPGQDALGPTDNADGKGRPERRGFVGLSSGAAMAGALKVAERMSEGTIVVILPDRGDRYLSVTQFRSICAKCPP